MQRAPHTLYFYPSSNTPRSSALRWNLCASAVRFCSCGLQCLRVLQFGCCILPLAGSPVAPQFGRVLWVSAISLFTRSRLLLLSGYVFFALFKPYGVLPPRAETESLHIMQRNVPTAERYLDDWRDQLFRYTFTGLSLCSTDMCRAAVLLCVCVCRIRVRVRTCHTTQSSSSAPAVQIPSITCACRCAHGTAYTLSTQHGHSSVCMYSGVHTALAVRNTYMCSAAVLLCVCVCRMRARVRTRHTT